MQGNQDQEQQDVEQIPISLDSKHCSTTRHLVPRLRKALLIYVFLRTSQH